MQQQPLLQQFLTCRRRRKNDIQETSEQMEMKKKIYWSRNRRCKRQSRYQDAECDYSLFSPGSGPLKETRDVGSEEGTARIRRGNERLRGRTGAKGVNWKGRPVLGSLLIQSFL